MVSTSYHKTPGPEWGLRTPQQGGDRGACSFGVAGKPTSALSALSGTSALVLRRGLSGVRVPKLEAVDLPGSSGPPQSPPPRPKGWEDAPTRISDHHLLLEGGGLQSAPAQF